MRRLSKRCIFATEEDDLKKYNEIIGTRFDDPDVKQQKAWVHIYEDAIKKAQLPIGKPSPGDEKCWECGKPVSANRLVNKSWCPTCAARIAKKNLDILKKEMAK